MWVALAILAVLAAMIFAAYRWGGKGERGRAAEASNEVKDKQLQEAADAPRTRDELVDKIRKEGW